MSGHWQPYPNHPQVRELTDRLFDADPQQQILRAVLAGDHAAAELLLQERQVVQARLGEVTTALLRDENLVPRWVAHRNVDAAAGAVPCLECGNNIPAGESTCSYCSWTYLAEGPVS